MKAIGIDIGTTTISGVVLDVAKRQVLEARTVQNGSFIKTEHEWERIQDVADAWNRISEPERETCKSSLYLAGRERKSLVRWAQTIDGTSDGQDRSVYCFRLWTDQPSL